VTLIFHSRSLPEQGALFIRQCGIAVSFIGWPRTTAPVQGALLPWAVIRNPSQERSIAAAVGPGASATMAIPEIRLLRCWTDGIAYGWAVLACQKKGTMTSETWLAFAAMSAVLFIIAGPARSLGIDARSGADRRGARPAVRGAFVQVQAGRRNGAGPNMIALMRGWDWLTDGQRARCRSRAAHVGRKCLAFRFWRFMA
jgi:hypothetical protein